MGRIATASENGMDRSVSSYYYLHGHCDWVARAVAVERLWKGGHDLPEERIIRA